MNTMTPISDDDLVLYFYDDGLDAPQRAAIAAALVASAPLRARLVALEATLALADATPVPVADVDLGERLWRRIEPRLRPASVRPTWLRRLRAALALPAPPRLGWAAACALALAVGVGFFAGRQSAPTPDEAAQARANAAAARVLDAYVAAHLRTTEGVLLTAGNSADATLLAGNRERAAALVASNRLYARAAAQAGDLVLADFLQRLEPVLLSLANRASSAPVEVDEGLRDYLRDTDLLFQVRATQVRLDHQRVQRT
ncbi:Hypothetical protein I596_3610 [Dokdonella koreensis DS-123]|uniref:Uncharacterized protein n=2 Tax=Dokdonella TaxID=323413 RepID=A0A160DXX0_9GAMM|nr:Hypothetical protein I596_3610 [Dokdonella koreensis DS-123]